jgi:hypothetical protein
VALWVLSWVPYGVVFGLSGAALIAGWCAEIALGLVGIAFAGSAFAEAVKAHGWRHAPGVAWRTLVHGEPSHPDADVVEEVGGT